ncbi:hypothetical protein [Lentzea flaviverrucosa]|uniref:Uncharacterized protein n=1 Tax=Lentzea flaviverrucosa TaxID=200379 RepID=A0A1H9CDE9_9PSEU|nr:hypothetical protein [Lentzea flaviverrucosa]RDI24506.1 hypothetical protein DFR72_10986 [Lentzea flaviverrucosa]SEP98698.1 hypothetical protein SAMN05216195_101741 [Lentzea flaviverrucosa]
MKSLPFLRASLALKQVRKHLPKLRGQSSPEIDMADVRTRALELADDVNDRNAVAAQPVLFGYVDAHIADWLANMKTHHDTVQAELDLLSVRVTEVKAFYQIHHDDQQNVLDDLEAAVSHALERLSDPDAPFYNPEPRNKRRGRDS